MAWRTITCGTVKYTRLQTGCLRGLFLSSFLIGVALNLALSGCGRISFELDDEEIQRTREGDASRTDAGTRSDADVRSDIDATTDTGSVLDSEAADTGSAFDADEDSDAHDASEDVVEYDATSDADESDATSSNDAADDPDENTCGLTGVTYTEGEAAELSGTLLITAAHSGKCAAIDGDSVFLGAVVVQHSCDYSPSQLWEPFDRGEGWYVLRSVRSGHYIGSKDGDTSEGIEVVQWDNWYSDTYQFKAVCVGDDQWRIVNRASDLSLTVENASTENGAYFIGRTNQDRENQRFQIESQTDVFVPVMPTAEQGSSTVWRYTTNSPPFDWMEEGFDDSGWAQGPGGFGEGDDRGNIGTSWNTFNIWLRTTLELSSPLPASASLRIYHDEGAEVYINGVLAFSNNAWVSGYLQAELSSSADAALQVGTNVFAVHCRNTTGPQYIDIGFGSYAWEVN